MGETRDRIELPGWYYQNFDADFAREVPAESYGGWKKCAALPFSLRHSALVVMHAWDCKAPGEYPGWEHAVEYLSRARGILAREFPPILAAARSAGLRVVHVVGGGNYYQGLAAYRAIAAACPEEPPPERVAGDAVYAELAEFRRAHVHPGRHNEADIDASRKVRDFAPEARPEPGEAIAATTAQLFRICQGHGVNHLVYIGFAINWCLQMSPCCMIEMLRHGLLCSTIREATTAVENRESARTETAKNMELWKVALQFGFVYEAADFIAALRKP
jgi:hypothetical protein